MQKVGSVKEQVLEVRQMQDYIQAHLKQEISLPDLSKESLLSL